MVLSDLQDWNALLPIVIREFGSVILSSFGQFQNADSPMEIMFEPKVISTTFVLPLKALSEISVTALPR